MAVLSLAPLDTLAGLSAADRQLASLLDADAILSATGDRITFLNLVPDLPDYLPYATDPQTEVEIAFAGRFAFGPLDTVSGRVETVTISLGGQDLLVIGDLDLDAARVLAHAAAGESLAAAILSGADTVTGSARADVIFGHDGNDLLRGGDGSDNLLGMRGDDILVGGAGADLLTGQSGADALFGGLDDDVLSGRRGADVLRGGRGDDIAYGGTGSDRLLGFLGRDILVGEDGDDILSGGGGRDRIDGGAGDDILTGGRGGDSFVFARFGRSDGAEADTIADFEAKDTIRLGSLRGLERVEVAQSGADVTIALGEKQITVLGASLDAVEAAIEVSSYSYFGY